MGNLNLQNYLNRLDDFSSLYNLTDNTSVSNEKKYLVTVCHQLFTGLCKPASASCPRDITVNIVFNTRKIASNPIKPLTPTFLPER